MEEIFSSPPLDSIKRANRFILSGCVFFLELPVHTLVNFKSTDKSASDIASFAGIPP